MWSWRNARKVTLSRLLTFSPSQYLLACRRNRPSATWNMRYLSSHRLGGCGKNLGRRCYQTRWMESKRRKHPKSVPLIWLLWILSSELTDWAVTNCTAGLHRIGKGQLPAGLITTCRSPKITKHMAGGNDQLQRICRLGGIAKGKDGATATNSSCANVAFVAGTHQIATSMITYAKQPTSSRSDDAHRKRP